MNGVTLSGGVAIIAGSEGQTVTFVGSGGDLVLDDLPAFSGQIAGLSLKSQKVDLGGFAYSTGETVSWTQAVGSGVLTVTDGAKVASLALIGTYVTSNFMLSDDGQGGTFVVDPPVAGQSDIVAFAQVMAGFDGVPDAAIGPVGLASSATAFPISGLAMTHA